MIRIKDDSVNVGNLHASVWAAIYNYRDLRLAYGVTEPTVITSGNDGHHSYGSLHWMDRAADCRTKDIVEVTLKKEIVADLKELMGLDYDIVLERIGEVNEHLHIECHPKQR